jgi:hypothetical protein
MSKNKIIKGFSELRSAWKQTETESEAKALMKSGGFSTRKLPKRPAPIPSKNPRSMSATDKFIEDTLAIPLKQLPLDQLYDARLTVLDAIECAFSSKESILHQLDTIEDHVDDQGRSWKQRAEAALRHKVREGQELKKQLKSIDEMIAREKPPLKLVEAAAPSITAAQPVMVGKIYRVPIPNPRLRSEDWRQFQFEQLVHPEDCFPFPLETTPGKARRVIGSAQRALSKRFSYRTREDGHIWVWLAQGDPIKRARKS